MKKDYDSLNLGSITIRLATGMIKELDLKYGPGLKYQSRSEVVRSLVTLGLHIESLMEIQKDPKRKQEFDEKLSALYHEKNVEKTLETMNEDQLNSIIFYAQNIKDKKVQLLI